MNSEKLKPCPFCGGEAEIKRGEIWLYNGNQYDPMSWNGWIVSCKNCNHIEEGVEKSEAVAAWNRRNYSVFPNSSKLSYKELEKMVKPLEWRMGVDGILRTHLCESCTLHIMQRGNRYDVDCNARYIGPGATEVDAKKIAQNWYLDIVAAALGVERSGE